MLYIAKATYFNFLFIKLSELIIKLFNIINLFAFVICPYFNKVKFENNSN